MKLNRICLSNFKSIRDMDLSLGSLNVFIGANGAGKSNFVDFFRFLENMARKNLQSYVLEKGGARTFMHGGETRQSESISAVLDFGINAYSFSLKVSPDDNFIVTNEGTYKQLGEWRNWDEARKDARIGTWAGDNGHIEGNIHGPRNVCGHIFDAISNWRVYHFHDTSSDAPLRCPGFVGGDKRLFQDGSNLAPFLYSLQINHHHIYKKIVQYIQIIAPFFEDFAFEPESTITGEKIWLRWRHQGEERLYQPWQLSDGTLRFMALVTTLLQPFPPSTILIDEPELGLHPHALQVLCGLLQDASQYMQVIVTTQAPAMLAGLQPEDVIVVNRKNKSSIFSRLDALALQGWLQEYTLEELWWKNVIHAGPNHE